MKQTHGTIQKLSIPQRVALACKENQVMQIPERQVITKKGFHLSTGTTTSTQRPFHPQIPIGSVQDEFVSLKTMPKPVD